MSTPRLSIGMPVYNGEHYLRSAVDSILHQDFTDFELIISDNASSDLTSQICKEYARKDRRIRYFRNESNIGATGNYNRVFDLARGQFFKWASHDDEVHPSFLRRCLESFDHSPTDVVLVFSKADIIDEAGRVMNQSPDTMRSSKRPFMRLASLIYHRQFAHPLWGLVRSDALRKTRLMGCVEADHVLLGELGLLGNFVEIPEVLYRQRRHAKSAIEIHRTARQLLAWHDPSRANARILLPHWVRWDLEYFRAIRHIPLSAMERLVCYGVVRPAILWRWLLWRTGPVRHRLGLRREKTRRAIIRGAASTNGVDPENSLPAKVTTSKNKGNGTHEPRICRNG
jgi:glycosyltransferase involved in cell wall biosynthesis